MTGQEYLEEYGMDSWMNSDSIIAHLRISESTYNNLVIDSGRDYAAENGLELNNQFWWNWWWSWKEADKVEMSLCASRNGDVEQLEIYKAGNVVGFTCGMFFE